jgi:hypothetical protein
MAIFPELWDFPTIRSISAIIRGMPALTRKRVNDRPVTWHVHYAGVRVGVNVERSGAPPSSDQWQWCCGFYPGSDPGDDRHGMAWPSRADRDRSTGNLDRLG